jgi:hypothetical protein
MLLDGEHREETVYEFTLFTGSPRAVLRSRGGRFPRSNRALPLRSYDIVDLAWGANGFA